MESAEVVMKPVMEEEGGQFTCALCHWSERYHGRGSSVPFARGVIFHEDAYVMRDPFVPYGQNLYVFLGKPPFNLITIKGYVFNHFLNLGANCSVCSRTCCQQCSLYYTKRFCNKCAQENVDQFPVEVQKKIRDTK